MTLRSPLFRKLFLGAAAVTCAAMAGLGLYLTRFTSSREIEAVRQKLEVSSRILAAELASLPSQRLEAWSNDAGRRAGARVTLIDPSGKVLADSEHDPEPMANHPGPPEPRVPLASLA